MGGAWVSNELALRPFCNLEFTYKYIVVIVQLIDISGLSFLNI